MSCRIVRLLSFHFLRCCMELAVFFVQIFFSSNMNLEVTAFTYTKSEE